MTERERALYFSLSSRYSLFYQSECQSTKEKYPFTLKSSRMYSQRSHERKVTSNIYGVKHLLSPTHTHTRTELMFRRVDHLSRSHIPTQTQAHNKKDGRMRGRKTNHSFRKSSRGARVRMSDVFQHLKNCSCRSQCSVSKPPTFKGRPLVAVDITMLAKEEITGKYK